MIKLVDILKELDATYDHYVQRKGERNLPIAIPSLAKTPLKDYSYTEVFEALRERISQILLDKLALLEKANIAMSTSHDVGIKVLKPILVVDNKEYPVVITTEAADENGNMKQYTGVVYFAIVKNDRLTTVMTAKEDSNIEIEKDMLKHSKGKPAAVSAVSGYITKIDLDELMGQKEKVSVQLIDPTTLPYKLRTDYRKGASFTHNAYGTGKIINTSAGSGGEGDSNGRLEWVEVDFGKPVLKGGKLIPYRRIENILTLVSPLLKK
jgi:hypothetical protein